VARRPALKVKSSSGMSPEAARKASPPVSTAGAPTIGIRMSQNKVNLRSKGVFSQGGQEGRNARRIIRPSAYRPSAPYID
jgi:hypothetical protein